MSDKGRAHWASRRDAGTGHRTVLATAAAAATIALLGTGSVAGASDGQDGPFTGLGPAGHVTVTNDGRGVWTEWHAGEFRILYPGASEPFNEATAHPADGPPMLRLDCRLAHGTGWRERPPSPLRATVVLPRHPDARPGPSALSVRNWTTLHDRKKTWPVTVRRGTGQSHDTALEERTFRTRAGRGTREADATRIARDALTKLSEAVPGVITLHGPATDIQLTLAPAPSLRQAALRMLEHCP